MQVRPNGTTIVFEYASNAEIAKHIAVLTAMLHAKLEDPRRMSVGQLHCINAHGGPGGEIIHRTEF